MKITRRQMASVLAAPGVILAQTPPAATPGTPDEELKAARDQIRQNGELLAKVAIPAGTEPAVHFKA